MMAVITNLSDVSIYLERDPSLSRVSRAHEESAPFLQFKFNLPSSQISQLARSNSNLLRNNMQKFQVVKIFYIRV